MSASPPSEVVLPGVEDPAVAGSVGAIGGPVGRFARLGVSWWTPVRVLVAIATSAYVLGYVLDLGCRREAWAVPQRYEHLCYTDISPLFSLRGFADGLVPYVQSMPNGQYLEYPVLTGVFMQIAAWITNGWMALMPDSNSSVVFFDVNVVLLFLPYLVAVLALALTVRRRPWDAALLALAPTVILAATINWDLLPLAFIGVALLLWARRYPFAAGLLLGLAIAAKFYPLVLLGGFLVLSLRSGKWKEFGWLALGTAITWLAVNLPVMLANFDGWFFFYSFSKTRGEDFGSIWFALTQAGLGSVPPEQLNTIATGLFVILCIGIALIVLMAPRRPRLASVLFLIVAAFTLTNKVYSPQYVLWLVPLAVMARPRWRDFLIWQVGELVYFVAVWWFLLAYGTDGQHGLTGTEYSLAILIRVVATVYFAVIVIQDMLVTEQDPIRTDGFPEDEDDPGGGVYDGAPDVFTLRRSPHRTATS